MLLQTLTVEVRPLKSRQKHLASELALQIVDQPLVEAAEPAHPVDHSHEDVCHFAVFLSDVVFVHVFYHLVRREVQSIVL